jgi:hypothetical protein
MFAEHSEVAQMEKDGPKTKQAAQRMEMEVTVVILVLPSATLLRLLKEISPLKEPLVCVVPERRGRESIWKMSLGGLTRLRRCGGVKSFMPSTSSLPSRGRVDVPVPCSGAHHMIDFGHEATAGVSDVPEGRG